MAHLKPVPSCCPINEPGAHSPLGLYLIHTRSTIKLPVSLPSAGLKATSQLMTSPCLSSSNSHPSTLSSLPKPLPPLLSTITILCLNLSVSPHSWIGSLSPGSSSAAAGEVLYQEQQRHLGLESDCAPWQCHWGLYPGTGRWQRRAVQGLYPRIHTWS